MRTHPPWNVLITSAAAVCISGLDEHSQSNPCVCPLTTIGQALSVTSIAVLIFVPLRLYTSFLKERNMQKQLAHVL